MSLKTRGGGFSPLSQISSDSSPTAGGRRASKVCGRATPVLTSPSPTDVGATSPTVGEAEGGRASKGLRTRSPSSHLSVADFIGATSPTIGEASVGEQARSADARTPVLTSPSPTDVGATSPTIGEARVGEQARSADAQPQFSPLSQTASAPPPTIGEPSEQPSHLSVAGKDGAPKKSIARSAAAMGAATFLSRIAGLVREQTFAYLFGAGSATDAFNVAFRIPNMLRDLFAEGAMSAAFVPTFNGILKKDGKEQALKLTNLTFCALLVVVGALTVLGIIFSPQIVSLIAPEFCNNPDKFNVTVTMTRIMCPFLLVISWAAVSMGLLNSLGEFFVPSAAPIFLNLSMIIAGFTLCPLAKRLNMPAITGMAIGAMLGGALQFLAQLPAVMRHGFRFKWALNFNDPGIRRIVKLMIPGTVGLAATQINVAISTILSTSQGDGAVSWLSYSFRITQLPLGLFGVAVAQATLPVISRQAADNDKRAMASTIAGSMRLSGFISLFSCFAIMALAEPAVRILFQHGRFGISDTLATAIALRANVSGLLFFSLIKILGPAFYALNETKTPVIASICAVISNIAFNLMFIKPFGYWGLALGTSLGAVINFGILFVVIQKRLGSFKRFGLINAMSKIFAAAFCSGAAIYAAYPWLEGLSAGLFGSYKMLSKGALINSALSMGLALLLGIAVLYLLSALFKIEEAAQAKSLVVKRLFKRFKHGS